MGDMDAELYKRVGRYLKNRRYAKPRYIARQFNISVMLAIRMLKLHYWEKADGKTYVPP